MEPVAIRTPDHAGRQITACPGRVLQHTGHAGVLPTVRGRTLLDLGFVVLETGDRWTEYFRQKA